MKDFTLTHHGILGQKWGKRNGPPYPLDAQDHSTSEKKAGWKKSLDKSSNDDSSEKKKGLSDKQKKVIKIGVGIATTAATAGGIYYLYKTGRLDKLIEMGQNKANKMFSKKVGSINDQDIDTGKKAIESMLNQKIPQTAVSSIKKLSCPESLSESLEKVNPLRGTVIAKNNCTLCSVAGFLRTKGFDAVAGTTGGEQQILGGIIEECFKGAKVIDGSATKFGRSVEDASQMLVKKFGDNASGVCSIQWKDGKGGHAFNWFIENGVVSFADFQEGKNHDGVKKYWSLIDPNNSLTIARLDNAEINVESLLKYLRK